MNVNKTVLPIFNVLEDRALVSCMCFCFVFISSCLRSYFIYFYRGVGLTRENFLTITLLFTSSKDGQQYIDPSHCKNRHKITTRQRFERKGDFVISHDTPILTSLRFKDILRSRIPDGREKFGERKGFY